MWYFILSIKCLYVKEYRGPLYIEKNKMTSQASQVIREHVEEKSIESTGIYHQFKYYNSYKYSLSWHINFYFVRHMVYCVFFLLIFIPMTKTEMKIKLL